jgi:predicted alpha/beta hydrolase family esterase
MSSEKRSIKTLILPGYSAWNREWAMELAAEIPIAEVHHWRHWETGGTMVASEEFGSIMKRIGEDRVNLLAKSVGCRFAAKIIAQYPEKINNVVFCGIPSTSEEIQLELNQAIRSFPSDQLLVIQNRNDPYASFEDVQKMLPLMDVNISVLERDRDDHHYPYPDEFREFLSGR